MTDITEAIQLSCLNSFEVGENSMDKVSVESFEAMEKLCENSLNPRDQDDSDDSLGDLSVPDFNDTLEEVDFMLSLGKKLQSRGVMKYPIPTVRVQAEDECTTPKSSAMHSSFVARLMARTSTSPVDPIEEFSYCCEDNQSCSTPKVGADVLRSTTQST